MKQIFMLQAIEKEGQLKTREGRINLAIKRLSSCANPNLEVNEILDECGLDDLTDKEEMRIKTAVDRNRKYGIG